jgi:phage regulator Rha-like protein
MRTIDMLLAEVGADGFSGIDGGQSNFGQTSFTDRQNGQTYRAYDMNRDGFTELVMGFTGDKARKFRRGMNGP